VDAGTKSEFLFLLSPFPDFFQLICNLMHETILFQRADFGYLNKLSTIVRTYSKTYLYILLDSDALFVPVLQVC